MTFHAVSKREPVNSAPGTNALGHRLSPRIAVSFDEATMRELTAAAAERGVPVAAIIRERVRRGDS